MSIISSHRRVVAVAAAAIPVLITAGWVAWPEDVSTCCCSNPYPPHLNAADDGADRVEP